MKNQFQQFFSPNLAEARPDGIYSLRSSKNKRGDDSLVVQGCFGVVAQLFDVDTKELSYLVRTRAMHAQSASTTIVPCQHISNKRWLIDHLCKHGLLIIDPKEFYILFQNSVQLCIQNARSKESMTRTGWDRKMSSFSTGAKLIAVDHARLEGLHLIANPSSTMQHSGRFESWLKHVFNPCAQNPILLAVLGMALSTITMRSTKVGNRWLHLFGLHGKGKTTALQCAASLFGNAVDPGQANPGMEHAPYLTKMNATNAGMEATLNGHYDRPMIADELGEASRLGIGKIAYMLHSGEGMSTGTSDRKLAEKLRWSTHLLSAGEVSLEGKMREEGPIMGGQLDRAVDIRTDGRMPIFFDIAPFDNMLDFAGALKSSCSKYYGTAAPKFIEYLLKNPDRLELAVETELPALVERLKPSNCGDGATRVVRFVASGLLTSLMAVDAGVFTCEKDAIYAAFELLTDLWWTERTASIPESRVAKKIVDMLQMEITHSEGENKPHEDDEDSLSGAQSQRLPLRQAESTETIEDGFLYDEKGLLMMTVATFEILFPDDHSNLRKQLLTSGTLIVDKNNGPRLSKRIFRNRRDYAMVALREAALNPWLDRHLNSIEAST